jgi:hypothetical protein
MNKELLNMKRLVLVLLGMFILVGAANAKPNQQEKDYLIETFRNTTEFVQGSYEDIWNADKIQFGAFYLYNEKVYAVYIADWNTKDVLMLKLDKTDFFTYKKYFKSGLYDYIPFEKAAFVKSIQQPNGIEYIEIEMEAE